MDNIQEVKNLTPSAKAPAIKRRKNNKIQDTFGNKVLEWITTIVLFLLLIVVGYPVIYVISSSIGAAAGEEGGTSATGNAVAEATQQLHYALIVISTVPVLVAYAVVQKYFKGGVMVGSVKG